jgi:trimeric autotransporter adhesin
MSWYYTEPRPGRRPLDPVPGTTSGGGGGPPSGPAGGDLVGSYPNPTIAPGAVGNAEITDVAWAKVTGAPTIPTTLPPSGPASGDLTGTYPNPTIAANAVGNAEISDVAWSKVTGAPPPGSTILTGSGAPTVAVGVEGDYYIDTDTDTLYGPKASSVYGPAESPLGAYSPTLVLSGSYSTASRLKFLVGGQITALRFYRAAASTATSRTLKLWRVSTGTLVASAVTAGESGEGWITATLATPFAVNANDEFWAGYDESGSTIYSGGAASGVPTHITVLGSAYGAVGSLPATPDPGTQYGYGDVVFQPATVEIWPVAMQMPTTLPPSGSAGGDLTGTYPNPTLGAGKVTNAALAASGLDASKLTTGTLPVAQVPNLDAAKITTGTLAQARLPVSPSGLLTANLNDSQVTDAKIVGMAYSKLTGAPTSLPPSGTAGGDLVGSTYPNPVVAAGAITAAKIAAGVIPTTLPPSGAATGSLAGSYPAPSIAASAVRGTPSAGGTAREIAKASIWGADDLIDASVSDAKIAGVAYAKVTGAPTSLPPSGTAGGDLAGTYPNPTIGAGVIVDADVNAAAAIQGTKLADAPNGIPTAKLNDGAVTDAKIADVAYAKVTGAPTALPPSGAAGGDLAGTYPNPTVGTAKITRAKTATDLWLAPVPVAGDVGKLLTVTTGPTLVWQAGGGGPPTGAAGGSLAGTYPNPTLAASGVTAGTYGTARKIAQVTVNAEGRVTAVVEVTLVAQWK